jgi:hypothetical protein
LDGYHGQERHIRSLALIDTLMYLICKSAHFVPTGPAPVDIR